MRLAVALIIPDPPAGEIDGLRRALGSGALGRIPAHVTLVPPVNVGDDLLDEALRVARLAAARVPPLRLALGPVATFWPKNPTIYLSVGGDLTEIGRLRDLSGAGPLARPTTQPFVPHVTLSQSVEAGHIPHVVAALGPYRATTTIERVHVLREHEGHRWLPLADAVLGGPTVVGRGGLPLELTVGDVLDPDAAALDAASCASFASDGDGLAPARRRRPFVVTARREGEVVGVAVGLTDDELLLDRLVVDAAARGQGIGSRILAEVELVGAERGCRRALVVCDVEAPVASWLRSRGWTDDLRLPAWRHGSDAVRLVRPLPVSPRSA